MPSNHSHLFHGSVSPDYRLQLHRSYDLQRCGNSRIFRCNSEFYGPRTFLLYLCTIRSRLRFRRAVIPKMQASTLQRFRVDLVSELPANPSNFDHSTSTQKIFVLAHQQNAAVAKVLDHVPGGRFRSAKENQIAKPHFLWRAQTPDLQGMAINNLA